MTDPNVRSVERLQAGARAAALFAGAVGLLVLAGWLFDVRAFMQVLPGQVAMVPNTALGFVLAGLALWCQAGVRTRSSRSASRAAAVLAGLIGLMNLAEYVSGKNLGIDELLFRDPLGLTSVFPGRMAMITALSFVALAASLLTSSLRRARWTPDALALVPGLLATISLTGYAYGVASLHWIGIYKGMAIHTALAFLILSVGALFVRSDGGVSRLFLSDTAGGTIARRIIPAALVVPVLLGWLDSLGERAHLYNPALGDAMSAVTNASVLVAVLWVVAERLRQTDEVTRRSQDALKASERRYQSLIAFAPIGIYRSTREGRFVSANLALARMLGYDSPEDVLRLDLRKDLYCDGAERERLVAEIARLGGVGTWEVLWKRHDGAPLWVRLDSRIVRGESGEEYEGFVHDIDQRKKAEEALRRSEERFHRAFSVSPAAMSLSEPKSGRILDINERFARLLGYDREELIGRTSIEMGLWIDPTDRERMVADLNASRPIRDSEVRVRTKTGETRHIVGAVEPLEVGEETILLSVFQDVTERKRAEARLQVSEERYRLLFEKNPLPVWVYDRKTLAFLAVNEATCCHYGYTREEFLAMTITDIRPPEEIPGLLEELAAMPLGLRRTGPRRHRKKDRTVIDVEITSSPFVIDGRDARLVLANDVTDRIRAEEGLRKSEERFRKLFDSNTIGIVIGDVNGATLEANDAYLGMLGHTREELLAGKIRWDQITPPEHRAGDEAAVEQLRRTGAATPWEKELFRKDGSRVPVLIGMAMLEASEGSVIAYILDLSERKRAEQMRATLAAIVQFSEDAIIGYTLDGIITSWNRGAEKLYGYSARESLGRPILNVPADRATEMADILERISRGESLKRLETVRLRKDGTRIEISLTVSAIRNAAGQVIGASTIARDITERKRAEESIQKLRQAVEQAENVIFLTDPDGHLTYVNPSFEALYGYKKEEALGQTPRILESGQQDPAFHAEFWTRPRPDEGVRGEVVNKTRDGRLVTVEMSASPLFDGDGKMVGFVAVQHDVTERKLLEQQFRQAQKMEAVGRLAGGVAHDFNNLLTAILGYAELLAEKLKGRPREVEDLEEIRKAGERAASLTRQLLAFSRQQVFERKVLDLNRLIAEIEKMLRRLIGEDIDLVIALDPALAYVWADAGQLEQVILNLAVNARDAMPRGGKLTIETSNVGLDEEYARLHPPVRPGRYVMIAVSDNGVGMDAETRSRIFEPFFTTKERGKGTGLGLATVYGIVKQSGGYIWAYSEPGKGTTFKVYLPPAGQDLTVDEVWVGESASPRGTETVLLVEDEESVRALARSILESFGYRVLEAAGAEEAVETTRRYQQPIHLLLTDVVMPSVGGPDLASRIQALRPGLKVLFMSGYTDETVFRHGHLGHGQLFLQKPFTPAALARKVREVLGA